MAVLFGLICGGSFVFSAFQIWFNSKCELVTFGMGARIVRTTCWEGYASVPHALTSGWAGTLSFIAGILVFLFGLGSQAAISR
jgi:hypothetical protein